MPSRRLRVVWMAKRPRSQATFALDQAGMPKDKHKNICTVIVCTWMATSTRTAW